MPLTEGPVLLYGSDQLEIRVTLACNERCVFCNSPGDVANAAMALESALELARDARAQGAAKLVLTGGEPLLVPWLPELVAEARALGYTRVCLQTNGVLLGEVLLGDEERAAGLRGMALDEILVSVHGADRETVGRITGRPDMYEALLRGLHAALAMRCRAMLNFVVCRQNLEGMGAFVRFVAGLPRVPDLTAFSFVAPNGRAWDNRVEVIPRMSDAAPRLLAALRLASSLALPVVHSEYCGIPTCLEPGLREFAEPCTDDRPMHVPPDKTKLPGCDRCAWSLRCSGVFRRYLELHGSGELVSCVGIGDGTR
jgi:MoaA/NifB/PqqE/SkfB family radical SAM enzyme